MERSASRAFTGCVFMAHRSLGIISDRGETWGGGGCVVLYAVK